MKSRSAARAATVVTLLAPATLALAADAPPTFTRDVAPILHKHCATCHRKGEIAPMPLLTYEEVRPWAKSIREKVSQGDMPPWHADPAHGRFKNDRRLGPREREVLLRWAGGGAAKGDPKDLPAPPRFADGWTIGEPDAVVSLKAAFDVPDDGLVPYQYFEVPTGFAEDRWIQALEVRPGNRSVVHHVLVFCREPNPAPRELAIRTLVPDGPPASTPSPSPDANARPTATVGRRGALLATTAPGMNATVFEPGTAMLIKAGSVLTFQIHYTTNGEATSDRSSIGFVFAKRPPEVEVRATAFTNGRFVIPPGAPDHAVESGVSFNYDVTLYSIFPHTHVRGKSWEYQVTYPDGRKETLLSVPKYDFNWQTDYVFAKPLRLPQGTVLKAVARYDNSARNAANPDPKAEVRWGEQTWEEMQYTGLNYSIDGKPPATTTAGR
jgi:hypothetical protein